MGEDVGGCGGVPPAGIGGLGDAGAVTLYCGDCLDILPTLGRVDCVVTDPPYGIAWKRSANRVRASKAHGGIEGDQDTSLRDAVLEAMRHVPGVVFGSFYAPFPDRLKQVLVWQKPADSGVVGSTTGFRRDAEPIFLVGPWPFRFVAWSGVLRSQNGISGITTETGHPHTKPIDLMVDLIRKTTKPGDIVLDPFCGSGTTGVACVRTGRRFIGIEISEQYFAVAQRRIAEAQMQPPLFPHEEERPQLQTLALPLPFADMDA